VEALTELSCNVFADIALAVEDVREHTAAANSLFEILALRVVRVHEFAQEHGTRDFTEVVARLIALDKYRVNLGDGKLLGRRVCESVDCFQKRYRALVFAIIINRLWGVFRKRLCVCAIPDQNDGVESFWYRRRSGLCRRIFGESRCQLHHRSHD
jgi:hypothetical protein